jgi:hypothetical protein
MEDARPMGQVLPPGTAHLVPVLDRGGPGCSPSLGLGDLGRLCRDMLLPFLQARLGVCHLPLGVPQTTEDAQRIPLGQVMAQMNHIRETWAAKPLLGQLEQRLGTVAHPVSYRGATRRQALVGTGEPGVLTSICCHCFHPHIARGQVPAHQPHLL